MYHKFYFPPFGFDMFRKRLSCTYGFCINLIWSQQRQELQKTASILVVKQNVIYYLYIYFVPDIPSYTHWCHNIVNAETTKCMILLIRKYISILSVSIGQERSSANCKLNVLTCTKISGQWFHHILQLP